ncbi:Y-family DNA polymerase [Arhodomonas sp. AD133]|uniref:Y-family DNA polymerase n=1 Tax=Arhodomonas sp. AD133 TaxID=3415009 RepID=UPI003EB79BDA
MALWLCLDFPALALEVFQHNGADSLPRVVIEDGRVHTANRAAIRSGIQSGMRLTAARALVPSLHCRERDSAAEGRALRQLAGWALQFTHQVCLQPPHGLLLEIGGSLRYFGGLTALYRDIQVQVAGLGYTSIPAVAPTPMAAWLLAHGGRATTVTSPCDIDDALAGLPVTVLPIPAHQLEALSDLGCRTVGDCLALPREGLARRFGHHLIRHLDRARGRLPDPRRCWQPPPRYNAEIALALETREIDPLLAAIERLLLELCGYLRGLESGVQRLQLRFDHHPRGATALTVGLLSPSRKPDHLLTLVRNQLECTSLDAAAHSIALTARDIRSLIPENGTLLPTPAASTGTAWQPLVERLSARLGEQTIHGLHPRAEHRPEYAWDYAAPGESSATPAESAPERPLWLLKPPRRLATAGEQPLWHGPLTMERGPERIETGWWDGDDVARDYYIACNDHGERLWIYRERRAPQAWFLHGLFA